MAVLAVYAVAALGASALGASAFIAGIAGTVASGLFSRLTADTIEQSGPRLDNLKVTSSSQGVPINIAFGTVGLGGNIIWSTDIVEEKTTTHTDGGKGGGGGVDTTTYSYYANFAVGLAEGQINAISRIWANGKIIYDVKTPGSYDASVEFETKYFRFYKGEDWQSPDH